MQALSIKDIRFMRILCYFTNFFLITPWYNFQNHATSSRITPGVWAVVVFSLKLYGPSSIIWCERNRTIFNSFLFVQKIICTLTLSTSVVFGMVQIVATVHWNCDKWKLLINNFEYIDRKLGHRNKKSKICKNFYFWFFIKVVIFLCFFSPQFYLWFAVTKIKSFEIFISVFVELVNNFLFSVILNSLLMCFYYRYKDLSKKLRNMKIDIWQIEEVKQLFRILGETIEMFNEMFGYQILFLILQTGLHLINYANLTFIDVIFKDAKGYTTAIFNCGINIFLIVSS